MTTELKTTRLQPKRVPLFECMECGKKFYSVYAAEQAVYKGCPKCNGSDIDIHLPKG